MSAKKKIYEVNDRVFAKVRGFPAWPARIMEVANASGSRYKVFFYGTYETATLKKEEIWEYNASSINRFGKGNQKRKGFVEGMYEIENMPDLKTAEALEAEEGGGLPNRSEIMDATMEEDASSAVSSPAASTPVAAPPATPKEKTPAAAKEKGSKDKATGKQEKTPAAKDKGNASGKEKAPPAKEKAKDKTPVPRERPSREKSMTPAPKDKIPPVKEKVVKTPGPKESPPEEPKDPLPATSQKKEESVEEEKSEVQKLEEQETEETEEKEDKEVSPDEEKAGSSQEPLAKEEEENHEVVTSSVASNEEESGVKSTPADTTTTEDEPMKEEEPEENTLVINETTPVARTRNNRSSNKRKADDITPSAPPPAKKKNAPPPLNVTPSTNETTHSPCATVSRSGRIIKPKKFVDDDDDHKPSVEPQPAPQVSSNSNNILAASEPVTSTQNSSNNHTTKTSSAPKKEPRKMWVEVKSTGDMIEINLDQDKPSYFESKEAELQWEKTTARNALKFKERVESGDFIPDEVRVKLEEKLNRTEEEEKILMKAKQNSLKMERIRWLKIEQKIIDLDIDIKSSCSTTKPDLESCLKSLNEFDSMTLAPLMLKKQPTIVNSISKLRSYVGPKDAMEGHYEVEAEKIRNKAEKIYSKLKSIFEVPEGSNFDDFFRDELAEFRSAVKSMEKEKLLTLVSDPTKKAKKKK